MVSADIVEKERFVVLDGMRGLAALAVITDHVHSPFMEALLPGRYLAVDFFFVLSGFVIAHAYAQRLAGGMSAMAFMRARVFRLYPLYLLGAVAGAALFMVHALKGWGDPTVPLVLTSFAFALTMLPCLPAFSFWPDAPYPLNGPSWSLFFELFINAVFAVVARWVTPAICLVFMGVGAIALVPVAFHFGQLDGGFAWSNFIAGFPRVTFGFFAGVFVYQTRDRWRFPALPAWSAYLMLFAIFAAPALGFWRTVFDLAAVLVLFPLLVALSAGSRVKGLGFKTSAFIGTMSYGVYVLHVPLWGWLQLVLQSLGVEASLPGLAKVALAGLAALMAAWVAHRLYDVPLRRALSRMSQPPKPARA